MNEIEESLVKLVENRYLQIVKANLTKREFKIIWTKPSSECSELDKLWSGVDLLYSFSEMKGLRRLRNPQIVHQKLCQKGSIAYKFRITLNSEVRWIQLEIVKSSNYSSNNVDVLIFTKDIEEAYGKEYNARKQAEKLARTDSLTGFSNRLAFEKFCSDSNQYKSLGIVYADLNSLKTVNDTEGHSAGDRYIKNFCTIVNSIFKGNNRYRMGGDEFIIICTNVGMIEFADKLKYLSSVISDRGTHMPICSFGYKWTDSTSINIEDLAKKAEKDMYKHKEEDYIKYNGERRRCQ